MPSAAHEVGAVGHREPVRRHHAIILVVCGILLVLAIFIVVGWANGGDAGDQQDQPTSGLARLAG
jgi:hypothetical protein